MTTTRHHAARYVVTMDRTQPTHFVVKIGGRVLRTTACGALTTDAAADAPGVALADLLLLADAWEATTLACKPCITALRKA